MNVDGACSGNPGPSGIGVVARNEDGVPIFEVSEYIGIKTNNVAEYAALIRGLEEADVKGYRNVLIKSDSMLVVKQVTGEYKCRDYNLSICLEKAKQLIGGFESFEIEFVGREFNSEADKLARKGAAKKLKAVR